MRIAHVEGAVLVGGRSRRMGRDKATLELDGIPLARRVADTLACCVERVRLVGRPDALPADLGYACIPDTHPTQAPIVGIAAALAAADTDAVLVCACDLPWVEPRLLTALLAMTPAQAPPGSNTPDIILPLSDHGPEPLIAVYRKHLLPDLESRIATDRLALMDLLASHADTTLRVDESIWRPLDPDARSFTNLNSPEDLPRPPR